MSASGWSSKANTWQIKVCYLIDAKVIKVQYSQKSDQLIDLQYCPQWPNITRNMKGSHSINSMVKFLMVYKLIWPHSIYSISSCKAAINDSFCYRLIVKKKIAHYSCKRTPGGTFKCLVLFDQKSETQMYFIYRRKCQRKTANPHICAPQKMTEMITQLSKYLQLNFLFWSTHWFTD